MRNPIGIVAGFALVLSGCGAVIPDDPNAGSIEGIVITSDENGAPLLGFTEGLSYSDIETKVVWEGDGDVLEPGDLILLDMYAVRLDGQGRSEDGPILKDTYTFLPDAYVLAPELLGEHLYNALVGQRVGARLLHVTPPVTDHEDQGPVAILIEVLPATAVGEALGTPAGFPAVVEGPTGMPTIAIGAADLPPIELGVAALIQGEGPQVREGSWIRASFVAVEYGTGEVFDSSWDDGEGPAAVQIGRGQVPAGWDVGLIDQAEGSRVLLLVPPGMAYGDKALAFVVDILAVWTEE